ncbi:MAG: aminoacyl-tRNA hydrolase [Methylococcaceae bacterium]|nr:aminoacyl-tRNA hydrolase [Methylococcaceae bacterium]MCI0668010.1 aminoacyl-tRNA hydrolase [Methylococcaceae bacterium]MCI0733192.1 aminoacyl-tRNA hydrolase [Methylococcaceae bacterium]
MADYFLIAGLGNPSAYYEKTRHNAGFWFVEKLASKESVEFHPESRFSGLIAKFACAGRIALLVKPLTFMNRTGQSIGAVSRYYDIPPDNILVAHDELDFPAGTVRLKTDGGHGGHNGLRDVISNLGANNFLRVRIGIGHPGDRSQVMDYVLGTPSAEDRQAIEQAIGRSAELLPKIVSGCIAEAMNRLNGG